MTTTYNPPIIREYVEPNAGDAFIWWLFKRRCIMCNQPASEINEIIPRSRSKKSITTWENRVTLCKHDHDQFHAGGVTDEKISEMQDKRISFLFMIGRDEYLSK